MRYSKVVVEGIGYELPPNCVTSEELEQRLAPVYERLELEQGLIRKLTGIRTRRFFAPDETPSRAAVRAGEKAIAESGIDRGKIGALFYASLSREWLEPATAVLVHHKLGLRASATVLDLSNACLGMLNGIAMLANMIELGQVEAGLVVAAELGEHLVDGTVDKLLASPDLTFDDFKLVFPNLTVGSGAAAVLLAHESISKRENRLIGGVSRCDTSAHELCRITPDVVMEDGITPAMSTKAGLFDAAHALSAGAWEEFKRDVVWSRDGPDHVLSHQVGAAFRRGLYNALELDPELDFSTYEDLGNMASVGLPLSLGVAVDRGVVRATDAVALLGVGSGLVCMMFGLEW